MKEDTRSFYEVVVRAAVTQVVHGLDEALDLAALARTAALSPLHFHRVFRGMVGETPLELHRRLRLERAAWRLCTSGASVTTIAFEAGYETHESFTRAFRDAYAASPTDLRARAQAKREACERPPTCELVARSGIHFTNEKRFEVTFTVREGGATMNVEIQTLPEKRVAAVSHVGPYNTISEAFGRLGALVGPAGLLQYPEAEMVGIYHDDPETKPQSELRSEAGIVVPKEIALPTTLSEVHIPAGRYACTTHVGPYTLLGDAWARFMGEWLPKSGHRVGAGVSYEIYRNTPMDTSPEALVTELYAPID